MLHPLLTKNQVGLKQGHHVENGLRERNCFAWIALRKGKFELPSSPFLSSLFLSPQAPQAKKSPSFRPVSQGARFGGPIASALSASISAVHLLPLHTKLANLLQLLLANLGVGLRAVMDHQPPEEEPGLDSYNCV